MSCSCLRLSVYKARRVAKQTSHLPCKCALVTDNGTALCTQLASQKHGVIVESGLESLLAACRRSLAWVQRLGSKEFQTWLSSQTPSTYCRFPGWVDEAVRKTFASSHHHDAASGTVDRDDERGALPDGRSVHQFPVGAELEMTCTCVHVGMDSYTLFSGCLPFKPAQGSKKYDRPRVGAGPLSTRQSTRSLMAQ